MLPCLRHSEVFSNFTECSALPPQTAQKRRGSGTPVRLGTGLDYGVPPALAIGIVCPTGKRDERVS